MSTEATEALIAQLDAVDDSPGAAALRARSYDLLAAAGARWWQALTIWSGLVSSTRAF